VPDLTSGLYRLDVAFYDEQENRLWGPLASRVRFMPHLEHITLDYFTVGDWPTEQATNQKAEPVVAWQNGAELVGMELDTSEIGAVDRLVLNLFWQTKQKIETDYTIFIHLVGPDGQLIAQRDQQPLNGFFPTKIWPIGQPLQDEYLLALPEKMESGTYRLFVGMYDPLSMQRSLLMNHGSLENSLPDAYQITTFNLP